MDVRGSIETDLMVSPRVVQFLPDRCHRLNWPEKLRFASHLARRTELDFSREIRLLLQGAADLFRRLVAAFPGPEEHGDEKGQGDCQTFLIQGPALAR
jgi:hypothetical protein